MEINYKALGKRIKLARIEKELTQEKLAELVGLSPTHMSNIESGTANVSLPSLVNIANALSLSVDDLLSDSVIHAKASLEREFQKMLDSCTEYEMRIVRDAAQAIITSLHVNEHLSKK